MLSFPHFVVEGHRGVQSLRPENTLASFQVALDLGLEFVELDLHCTKDGEIVIHHDFELENRLISSMTLEEVKKFDIGQTNPQFPLQTRAPNARVPLLSQLFEMAKNKKIKFNLEIKSDPRHPEYTLDIEFLAKRIVQVVNQYKFENRVYYSSFDPGVLKEINKCVDSPTIAFLYHEGLPEGPIEEPLIKICKELKAKIVSPHMSLLNEKVMRAFKKAGLLVIPWTVNEKNQYEELVSLGVDGIISDYPQLFNAFPSESSRRMR